MKTGIIKWFDASKGFGFITPADGSPELFLHGTKLEAAKIPSVTAGDTVSYDECTKNGKAFAINLVLVSTAAEDSLRANAKEKGSPAKKARSNDRELSGADQSLEAFEREWGLRPAP